MPKRSSCAKAYSKHSALTSQLWQTRFASRVDPPFSGKNASGSVCAHSASACQARAVPSSGGAGRRMGGADKALVPLRGRPLLSHVTDRFAPQVERLALSANGDPRRFAVFGLPVLPDIDATPVRVGVGIVGSIIVFGLIMGARSLNRRPQH